MAIYIRWSTEDQGEGTTLAVQSEACRHYLQSQGWHVREDLTFIDDGYSGGSLERPALTRLRQAVQQGQVDCVVVFKLDRLSRSVVDTVTLVLQEWADTTHLKSAREPIDTTTAMGKQFFYMLVSYAEWERNVIRERMWSGKVRRAREGRSPGMPAPYGYRTGKETGTLEVEPREAGAIRLAFDLAERGASVRQITLQLNRTGYPTRRGGPWGTSMVSKLLRNPAYAGRLVWGRRRVNPRHGRAPGEPRYQAGEPLVHEAPAAIPALIEPDRFDRVQERLASNRKLAPAAAGSEHLLSGLLRCGRCGESMQYNRSGPWAYYRCSARAQGLGCYAGSVPAPALEQAVAAAVQERYGARAETEARRMERGEQEKHRRLLTEELAAVREARQRLTLQQRRVNQDYLFGRIEATERRALLAQLSADQDQLCRRQRELTEALAKTPTTGGMARWTDLSPEQQKSLVRHFIDGVSAMRTARAEASAEIAWFDSPL